MKKAVISLFCFILLYADNTTLIKNLIGKDKFTTYYELLKPVLNETSLKKTISYLQNNGLLEIFLNTPQLIHPKFVFKNNNPVFNTKTLYDTLNTLGFYYFYPVKITKTSSDYEITLEMKSSHYIDPLLFINTLEQKGCKVLTIAKQKNYTYVINCENENLYSYPVKNKPVKLIYAKGIYWLNPNGFSQISINTSKFDNWYPYIVFYDKNLNILNIISKNISQKKIYLNIPKECGYIKITDNFSKENFKRGIYIKGIK
jgi:hypothetical protein